MPKCEFSAEPGRILVSNEANYFTKERLKHYQSFIVKLLHLMRHIRVESQNAIREASKFMNKNTGEAHAKCMHRVMKYLVEIRESGLFMEPKVWDGDLDFEFTIEGWYDYGYASYSQTRKGVCGHVEELNGMPVLIKSRQSKNESLLVAQCKMPVGVICTQHMLCVMRTRL